MTRMRMTMMSTAVTAATKSPGDDGKEAVDGSEDVGDWIKRW